MSFNYALPCNEVLNSFVLIVEGNIQAPHLSLIELHISQCTDCETELAHEHAIRTLLQDVLRRSCQEEAPKDLHDSIYQKIHSQMTGTFTEVVTQYSMTEISIEIDEFGQVEHREVTIEHTEEIRFLNEANNPDDLKGQGH